MTEFSANTNHAVFLAGEEARGLGGDAVAPEHLLLALTLFPSNASMALAGWGADAATVTRAIRFASLPKPSPGTAPFTPAGQEALEAAREVAARLRKRSVEPEHLLLGLTLVNDEGFTDVLRRTGVTAEQLQRSIAAVIPLSPAKLQEALGAGRQGPAAGSE